MGLGAQSRCLGTALIPWGADTHPIAHIRVWGVAGPHGRVSVFQEAGAEGEGVQEEGSGEVGNVLKGVSQGPVSVLGVSRSPRGAATRAGTG